MWFHKRSLFENLGISGGGRQNDDGAMAFLREEGITDDDIKKHSHCNR